MTLNLATQPFVNRRRFYTLTSAAAVVLGLTLAVLLSIFARNFRNEIGIRKQMKTVRQEIARLDEDQQQLEERLKRPEAADILDRNDFLNTLIRQKAVSWTRIFMDLEKVMPERVQAISLHPVAQIPGVEGSKRSNAPVSFDGPLVIDLKLQVSSEQFEDLVKLVRHLQVAPFWKPVVNTTDPQADAGAPGGQVGRVPVFTKDKDNLYKMSMSVSYAQ